MPQISKTLVDANLRNATFTALDIENVVGMTMTKVNDRQYGAIVTDDNGIERYVRVGVIVAEVREDMTARELMQMEIDEYNEKQASKAEKQKAKEAKIAADKKKREEAAAKKAKEMGE